MVQLPVTHPSWTVLASIGRSENPETKMMMTYSYNPYFDMKTLVRLALLLIVPMLTANAQKFATDPLVSHIFTADPSAHVFNGKIYIYPSHDIESNTAEDDEGGHFEMKSYPVLSIDLIGGKVTDHGVALDIKNIPWVG